MPKTYQFHHYNVRKRTPGKTLKRQDKQHFVESELHATPPGAEELHYGKKFAETERLAHEHAEHPRPPERKMSRPQEGVVRSHEVQGQPIGALPQTEEPFREPQKALGGAGWSDVVEEAIRGVQRLGGAMRDLGAATIKLARLPFDVARLLGRRTREA